MDENVQGEQVPQEQAGSKQNETAAEVTHLEVSKEAKNMATLCHILGLVGFPGPLIVWLISKDKDRFIDEQGKEAVNFQISMLIYGVVAALLIFACIGTVLLPAVAIFDLIFLLIAAVKTNDGQHYRYPLTIRFVK